MRKKKRNICLFNSAVQCFIAASVNISGRKHPSMHIFLTCRYLAPAEALLTDNEVPIHRDFFNYTPLILLLWCCCRRKNTTFTPSLVDGSTVSAETQDVWHAFIVGCISSLMASSMLPILRSHEEATRRIGQCG